MDAKIIVIEDNAFFGEAWRRFARAHVTVFTHPEAFFAAIKLADLTSVAAIVIDQYFDELSDMTGEDVAARLRLDGYHGKLLFSTTGEFAALPAGFDAQVGKMPEPIWTEHLQVLKDDGAR